MSGTVGGGRCLVDPEVFRRAEVVEFTRQELSNLKYQFGTSSWGAFCVFSGGIRVHPRPQTPEATLYQGVTMNRTCRQPEKTPNDSVVIAI